MAHVKTQKFSLDPTARQKSLSCAHDYGVFACFCNSTAAGQGLCLVKPYNYLHRFPSDGHREHSPWNHQEMPQRHNRDWCTERKKSAKISICIHIVLYIVSIACFAPRLWPVWQEALEQALKLCRPKQMGRTKSPHLTTLNWRLLNACSFSLKTCA